MSTTDRQRAEELLHIANTATTANSQGENPEAALLIAEAQVHATLAVAQALEPAEWVEPAKPTGWVYRVTVDAYPTEGGHPFASLTATYWHKIIDDYNTGDAPYWVPEDLEEWMVDTGSWGETVYPDRKGHIVYEDPEHHTGPLLVVPTLPSRRHWLSRSTARAIAVGLRAWGATVRLERAPFGEWEDIA
jgi:hypothetical protein